MDIKIINEAFSPTQEIQNPDLFVGRKEQIRNGIICLSNPGSFLAIYGLRGVGKSSIGHQLSLIASGNNKLPRTLSLDRFIPNNGFKFITYYIKIDSSIKNVFDLLKRILFGDDKNPPLFNLTKSGDIKLESFKKTIGIDGGANFFGAKINGSGKEEKTFKTYMSDDLTQQFRQMLGTVQKDNQDKTGIFILIDEFDTLKDKKGFSSLVKACSSEFVKFGIIGIASSITELIEDHSSVGRQIESIEIERMPETELMEIITKAEHHISKKILFDEDVKKIIINKSEGFPYFVHLLGREAMLLAYERGQGTINKSTIDILVKEISEGKLKTIYEDIYHAAVKNSPQREILLKAFSDTGLHPRDWTHVLE